MELPYDPIIQLLGIYLEKNMIRKGTCTPMFIAALFTVAKAWKPLRCPSTEDWVKKMWCMYMIEYYSAINKDETVSFAATWMDPESVILSEVSQTEEKYCLTSLVIPSLKKMIQMNLLIKQKVAKT